MLNKVKVEVKDNYVEMKRRNDRNPFTPKKFKAPELIAY